MAQARDHRRKPPARWDDVETIEGLAHLLAAGFDADSSSPRTRGEEDRQPAVEQFACQFEVLRADGCEVHGDLVAYRVHGERQRFTRPVRQRKCEELAVVLQALAAQSLAHDVGVLAGACQGLVELDSVPASETCGPDTLRPSRKRPPDRASSVAAVIAQFAGVRLGIWKMALPMSICSVCAATQASTVAASDPYASAAQATA